MLCLFCTNLCQTALRQAERLDQSNLPLSKQYCRMDHIPAQTSVQLLAGVGKGCSMCGRFWEYASEEYRQGVQDGQYYPPGNEYKRVNSFMINILLDLEDSRNPQENRRIYIYIYHSKIAYHTQFTPHLHAEDTQSFTVLLSSDLDPLLKHGYDAYSLRGDNSAPLIGEQIGSWMEGCNRDHSHCPKPRTMRGTFPTRLLQVGDTVTLRDTVNIDKAEKYVTLSYTWGESGVMKTTDDSISTLEAGVPLYTLPETLQDVINVTRSIGVKYIWIDSLCIIQDQTALMSDFLREAPHMGEIYSNSLLTIAASRGRGTHVSCFSTRNPSLLKPSTFNSPPDIKSQRYGSGKFYIIDATIWRSAVSEAPLNSRGWVLQERLLSPRTVHFCLEQTFWECSELAACESLPNGLPPKIMETPSGRVRIPQNAFKSFLNFEVRQSHSQSQIAVYTRWSQIVEEYSGCEFTNWTDRVVALAGIVGRLKLIFNDKFVAGLWKNHIAYGLAWEVDSKVRRPLSKDGMEVYCGPSWSWVSVAGKIKHDIGMEYEWANWEACTTVESCVVEPRGQEFGNPVREGTALCLRGLLYRLEFRRDQKGHIGQRTSGFVACTIEGEPVKQNAIALDTTEKHNHVGDQLAVTPILLSKKQGWGGKGHLISLILQEDGNTFRRIGLLHSSAAEDPAIFQGLLHSRKREYFQIV